MINCESAEKMSSNSANNRTSPAQKPSKNELKTRILNSILSRFSNNSSPTTTTTAAKKTSTTTTTTDNSIQKFSDKRIADLINPNNNNSKIAQPPKPTVNYSINESRLREITHTPYPNQMFYPCNYGGNQLPLIKPVALRPKKFDTTYDSSTSSFSASPTVISHSFRLSAQEQQWTYELNSNTQRNSRFINRRSTIARSEYSETPTVTNQVQKPATVEAAKPLTQSQTQPQQQQQHYHSMMMRPRLNLIKMKIHNLIENKPAANFSMIQELKEKQIEHQRKFQIPNVNNNSSTATNNNTSTKFEMLLNNINNTANTNSNSNSAATANSNSNGSLISLTSSTSSLLSSSSTSSLTSAVYSGGDDDSNSLSFDKFGPNEPKIDLDLIENDNEL